MKNLRNNFKPVPTIKFARAKFTLILLALLSFGYYVKADISCYKAIEVQQAAIDSLEKQLTLVTSRPFNQGYQAGYKAAKAEALEPEVIGEMLFVITFCLIFLSVTAAIIYNALKD
jgi:hypothetical protein